MKDYKTAEEFEQQIRTIVNGAIVAAINDCPELKCKENYKLSSSIAKRAIGNLLPILGNENFVLYRKKINFYAVN